MQSVLPTMWNHSRTFVQSICCVPKFALPQSLRFLATFAYRDFAYEQSHESGTLQSRFVKHIALENCKADVDLVRPSTIKYAQFYPVHDPRMFSTELKKIADDQLPRLLLYTYTFRTNADLNKLVHVVNELDDECLHRLPALTFDTILKLFYAYVFLIPNKVNQLQFYRFAISQLCEKFSENQSQHNFVQTCFYLGLSKKNQNSTEHLKRLFENNLDIYLKTLSPIEFAIVANAAFKCGLKILNKPYLRKLEAMLGVENSAIDIPMLITFVKCIRQNRLSNDQITGILRDLLLGPELPELELTGYVHLLAYFADNLIKDDELVEKTVDRCLACIEETGMSVRPKDISTLLWCLATLNTRNTSDTSFDMIVKLISEKLENGEYKYCVDELIDTTLSLWTLDQKFPDLVSAIEMKSQFVQPHSGPHRVRLDSRKSLLMSCVEIETSESLKNNRKAKLNSSFAENMPAPDYLTRSRNGLQKVFAELCSMKEQGKGLKAVTLVVPIKNLNIASIQLELDDQQQKVFVEVLDESTCLNDGKSPTGLQFLKQRLLDKLGYETILIPIRGLNESEICDATAEATRNIFLGKTPSIEVLSV